MIRVLQAWLLVAGCRDSAPLASGSVESSRSALPARFVAGPEVDLRGALAAADLVVVARRVGRPATTSAFGDRTAPHAIEEVLKGPPDAGSSAEGAREIHVLGPSPVDTPAVLFLARDARFPDVYRTTPGLGSIASDPWGRAITPGPHGPVLLRVHEGGLAVLMDGVDPYDGLYAGLDETLSHPRSPGTTAPDMPLPSLPADSTAIPAQNFRDAVRAVRLLAGRPTGAEIQPPRAR